MNKVRVVPQIEVEQDLEDMAWGLGMITQESFMYPGSGYMGSIYANHRYWELINHGI